ncbi:MAG TPA: sensor histidine kinase [Jatrophihabitans sp.]|nr:sensor histidine kinase [Jatrophihabitans sp.]
MTDNESPETSCGAMQPHELTRIWDKGWRRYVFPGLWLIYLGQTAGGVGKHAHGAGAVAGYVVIGVFAVVYLVALPMGWGRDLGAFWFLYGFAFVLTAIECVFAHQDALVFCVYLAVLTIASCVRVAPLIVAGMTVVAGLLPRLVPSWGGQIDWNSALSVALVSVAMFGFFRIIRSNIALAAARAEVARLAAENERSRIARDLHDLLGHSLTTITVKAGLARKLAERGDSARALGEIAEVEQLSRSTLGDVRAAVSAHREVTLAGELATAREVLRAAGVIAELPPTVAETDPALSELFGWVVREGTTNVVRHARATHVRITLGPRHIEIVDDGRGGTPSVGNGLRGLQERAEAAGATLAVSAGLTGFRLRVEVPAADAAQPAVAQPGAVLRGEQESFA